MKIAVTIDKFDVLGKKDHSLIRQMRKQVVPDGKVVVFLLSDYDTFKKEGAFPAQNAEQRAKNLSYLADFVVNYSEKDFVKWINEGSNKITYFAYDTNKEFDCRPELKKAGIPIKFIKWKQ